MMKNKSFIHNIQKNFHPSRESFFVFPLFIPKLVVPLHRSHKGNTCLKLQIYFLRYIREGVV